MKRMPREGDSDELSPFATERQARRIVKKEEYKVPTLDDITTLLKVVREESNVKAEVQQMQFTEKFPLHDYRLMLLPKEISHCIDKGDKLVFRGDSQDEVVLCTASSSYFVKEVETSNALLIMPTLKVEGELTEAGEKFLTITPINGLAQHYLELHKIPCVSLYRLRDLLHQNRLPWDWMEKDSPTDTYSMEMLLDHVQMSEEELTRALAEMPVVEHNGRLRWLSNELQDKFLNLIVEAFDDLDVPSINITHLTFSALRSFLPEHITDAIIQWFLTKMCTKMEEGDYNVNPDPFVRARAAQLLRAVARFEMKTFEKLLDEMLPVGIQMESSHLLGICVYSESVRGKFISYLSVEDLPENPRARLEVLFSMQKLWTLEEITPYLSDICSDAREISVLLYGLCRSQHQPDGRKCFCSLRPV